MEPNYQYPQSQQQPQPTPGPGLDYLNSIAAAPPAKAINPFILWGLIAAVLITVVIVVVSIASSGNTPTKQLTLVGASTARLQELTEGANNNIQSSELRSINSSLTLALTNVNRELADPLKAQNIRINNAKKDATVGAVGKEYEQVAQRLEDARLNGIYDRTYVRELSYLLKTLHANMEQLYKSTPSESLKTILETNDNNITPLLENLTAFQAD